MGDERLESMRGGFCYAWTTGYERKETKGTESRGQAE